MAVKKKAVPKKKAAKKKAVGPYTGPAVKLEDGVRAEVAKRGEEVDTAATHTGALIKPEGLVQPQKVNAD